MKLCVLALSCLASVSAESVLYDPATHVVSESSGCGSKSNPYPAGKTTTASITVDGQKWAYQVKVPSNYDGSSAKPLIIQHPGWGYNAKQEASGCGIDKYADSGDFVSVTVTGGDDNTNNGGPWYSWNAVGTTLSPGKDGATCTSQGSNKKYCYTSCSADGKCPSPLQCSWTTCHDTGPTASGTGYSPVDGFIPTLYDTLEAQLCIDTTREYVAGESNGGMMTYQTGATMSERLAAAAPQFGSFHRGFAMAPKDELPVIDIHGSQDTTVPANTSLSSDGYYYTTTAEIFALWEPLNGGDGSYKQYVTKWDGQKNTYCVQTSNGKTVRCMWTGGHNWFLNDATANGGLVTEFLLKWTNPAHKGFNNAETPLTFPNVTVYSEQEVDKMMASDIARTLDNGMPTMDFVADDDRRRAHYGNPARGCRSDEDAIEAGEGGVVCAPKVNSTLMSVECTTDVDCSNLDEGSYCMNDPTKTAPYFCKGVGLPVPDCNLGDFASLESGCPTDASVRRRSKAWPVCLGKGVESTPYQDGDFHCLLSCPYTSPLKDTHCPLGAKCQRGDLRHAAHGVCAYPKSE